MKNARSIINFNSLPVNIKKKHDALLLILYVFEINFCFPLIIHFTDFNQVGINVSALQIKKHNREQIQYLTEKKLRKYRDNNITVCFFGVTITGCGSYQNAINVTIFLKSLSLNFFFTTIDTCTSFG